MEWNKLNGNRRNGNWKRGICVSCGMHVIWIYVYVCLIPLYSVVRILYFYYVFWIKLGVFHYFDFWLRQKPAFIGHLSDKRWFLLIVIFEICYHGLVILVRVSFGAVDFSQNCFILWRLGPNQPGGVDGVDGSHFRPVLGMHPAYPSRRRSPSPRHWSV